MEQKIFLESDFISKKQKILLSKYLEILSEHNAHTNLVGKSTLVDPWNSHVLDSIQIAPLIENKALSILDMGSGAGFPGNVLSIAGFKDVTLLDNDQQTALFLANLHQQVGTNDLFKKISEGDMQAKVDMYMKHHYKKDDDNVRLYAEKIFFGLN